MTSLADALRINKRLSIPGLAVMGGGDPLTWAGSAYHAWDFLSDRARFAGVYKGPLANTPGLTYTRSDAQTAYAQNAAGVLIPFASGALRRTDKGVLIEGARTNLCLQSQTLDNGSWTKTRSSISANAIAAPDGTTTADKLVEDNTGSNTHPAIQTITISNTTAYAYSAFLKAGERTWARLFANDGTTNFGAYFNLATGAVGTTTGSVTTIVQALADGWYRCCIVFTSTNTSGSFQIRPATGDAGDSYNGDNASGLYVWGAQLEAGAFPSSPIVTTGSSATRAADALTVTSPNVDYPLSLFCRFSRAVDTGGVETLLQIDAGNDNDRAAVIVDASDRGALFTVSGAATQATLAVTGALVLGTSYKAAGRVTTNDIQMARGGVLATQDTSATNPATPSTIRFGRNGSGSQQCFGYIEQAAIWPRILVDSELTSITP